MFHGKNLVRTVGGLTQSNQGSRPNQWLQGEQIVERGPGVGGFEHNGVLFDPALRCRKGGCWLYLAGSRPIAAWQTNTEGKQAHKSDETPGCSAHETLLLLTRRHCSGLSLASIEGDHLSFFVLYCMTCYRAAFLSSEASGLTFCEDEPFLIVKNTQRYNL
jgi:hypothetical protein